MLTNPTFLFIQVMNGLSLGMNLFIIAAGLTLIFGVLRIINFAHGSFYMVGAYVSWSAIEPIEQLTGHFWVGVLAAGLSLGAVAWAIERSMLRHLYGREHLYQLLFTFALVLIISDAAKLIWGASQYSVSYPPELKGATNLGISFYPTYLLFICVLGPIIAIVMWLVLAKTRWGRIIRAATQDREMLSALGLNVPRIYTSVFIVGSALAGIGGALAAPRAALTPGMDTTIIVESFIIVIIGGLGSLWGSFIGAIVLGMVTAFGTFLMPNWEIVLTYLLMLVVLMWRPWGLFGRPEREGAH